MDLEFIVGLRLNICESLVVEVVVNKFIYKKFLKWDKKNIKGEIFVKYVFLKIVGRERDLRFG